MAEEAYAGIDDLGYLKIPGTSKADIAEEFMNLTPKEGVQKLKELYKSGKLCKG